MLSRSEIYSFCRKRRLRSHFTEFLKSLGQVDPRTTHCQSTQIILAEICVQIR